ncbi:MAG: lipoxygenase family protein [Myxococcota bacterium]
MTKPLLPQFDPQPKARAAALAKDRDTYAYTYAVYDAVALAKDVPKQDEPPPEWSAVVNRALKLALVNIARADRVSPDASWRARLADVAPLAGELLHGDLRKLVNDIVADVLAGDMGGGKATSADDFAVFFQTIPVPDLARHLHDDATFARRFLAGANPEILEAAPEDPDFPVTDAHLRAVVPDDTLAAARAAGRLFVADYGMVDGAPANTLGGVPRWVTAPRAMLVVPPEGGPPRIIAIQIGRTPAPDAPIFTPKDGWGWEIAKLHVAVADTVVGAIWFHHARTHLVAEPIFLAMRRQLAPAHPVRVLLEPHALGTLSINHVGANSVFADHGLIDWIGGTTRAGMRDLARRSVQSFHFDQSVFPDRLARRGVQPGSALAEFPWRDDGLLVWDAVVAWTRDYLRLYYRDDADVIGDIELQGWLAEMTAPDGGGLVGIGEAGLFRTLAGLERFVAQLVFSVSAEHSAMNFPVSVEMTVVPNSPFAIYTPPPTRTEGWTEADWLAALPPMDQGQRQFGTALLLGESRFGQLGEYPADTFEDPAVAPVLARFRAALSQVERAIGERNRHRTPYIHMLPSRIAPSINI